MSSPPHPDEVSLSPGFLVGGGRFTLMRLLGRGGMGMVWLARDEQLHEDVALKFLPPEIRHDAVALDDLRRETARSRKLTHSNIIRIHDFYRSEHEAFISMEYVDGPNMSDLRLEQPNRVLTWTYLEPLVKQLCEALDYAHGEKIVHRDLKPANMMLDSRGRLKLADFGIAAAVSDSVTRISMIRHSQSGTSTYMSPQQMDGRLPQVTDDIYALGATLYELLTSRPPFFSGDVPHQVRTLSPQPIDERLAELEIENPVPPAVAAMIMVCLAKDAAQRPQSARAVAEWLGLQATTTTTLAQTVAVREPSAETYFEPEPPKTEVPITEPPATSRHVTLVTQPEAAFAEPERMPEPEPVAVPRRAARLWTIGAVALVLAIASVGWWAYHREAGTEATIDAMAGDDTTEEFVSTGMSEEPTKRERTFTGHAAAVNAVAISRDGRTLVSGSSDKTALVWDAATAAPRATLSGHAEKVNAVALSPDGTVAATASDDHTLRLWDVATGGARHVLMGHKAGVTAVAFAPAKNLLASGDASGVISIWNVESGARIRSIRAHSGRVFALAFRDAGVLASAGADRGFRVWNVDTGKIEHKQGRIGTLSALAFSPDGQLLAFTSSDETLRFWDAVNWQPRRAHKWPKEIIHGLSFSPDSKYIGFATESGAAVVWELNGTRRRSWKIFRGHVGPVNGVSLSNTEIASAGADKFVKLSTFRDATAADVSSAALAAEDGFVSVFNGRDLAGWHGDPEVWSVVNGALRGELLTKSEPSCITWRGGMLENFELRFSFRLLRAGNSGVCYRARELGNFTVGGYQFEIMRGNIGNLLDVGTDRKRRDLHRQNNDYTGGSDWREGAIRAEGGKITHSMNGAVLFTFYDTADEAPASGVLALEVIGSSYSGPSVVEFKDIRMRRLPPPK